MADNKKILKTKMGLITFIVSVIHLIFVFYLYWIFNALGTESEEAQMVIEIFQPIFILIYIVPNFITMYRVSEGYFKGKELFFYKARKPILFLIIIIIILFTFLISKGGLEINFISLLGIFLPIIQRKLCKVTYNEMSEIRKELNDNKEEDIESRD